MHPMPCCALVKSLTWLQKDESRVCTCEQLLHVGDGLEHGAFTLALTAVRLRLLQLALHLLQLLCQELPLCTACCAQLLISAASAQEGGPDFGPKRATLCA